MFYWSSPPNWSASALAEHLNGVLPHGGGTRLDPRCAVARHGPSRELGPCPKELDGLSCMHQLFPGREPHQLYFVVLERGMLCKSIRNRCSCRTVPATRRSPRTSHRFKFKRKWRKTVFRLAFKALEVLLVVLQIIQCFCEMFKK